MLKPHEFSAGMLSSAKPLSLLLPRGRYEQPFLIGARDGQGIAVLLSNEGDYRFQAFPNAEAHNWNGLIVAGVSIEVDETSVFDPSLGSRLGSIVRSGTTLAIAATPESWRGGSYLVPLVDGLPDLGDRHSAGFTRWQIVIGDDADKRVLKSMSVELPEA